MQHGDYSSQYCIVYMRVVPTHSHQKQNKNPSLSTRGDGGVN